MGIRRGMAATGLAAALGVVLLVLAIRPAASLAQSSEEAQILAVVEGLFDAMREKDVAKLESLFTPDATLRSAGEREGVPFLGETAIADFAASVGRSQVLLNEVIHNPEVRVDGRLATVWTAYDFFAGEQFSHCGVDAFHLFRGEDGWKIFHLADTRRREGCGR